LDATLTTPSAPTACCLRERQGIITAYNQNSSGLSRSIPYVPLIVGSLFITNYVLHLFSEPYGGLRGKVHRRSAGCYYQQRWFR